MNRNRKMALQLFAAEPNVITTQQITVNPREVDFVTSFGNNLTALTDVLGIVRPIEKPNGTQLVSYTASGELQSGDVAEGDVIPLSQYSVAPVSYQTITLKKYRKAVTAEAVLRYGAAAAVDRTDAEFQADLRGEVLSAFYNFLLTGQLTGEESTLQMAIAMAIGRIRDAFGKMHKDVTRTAVFVNTLDLYAYLGAAQVTVQTAFGMNYLENFLGADLVFYSSEIPQGRVIATPVDNIIAYYVNPSNSELQEIGLRYTVDSVVPYLGYASDGNYIRAQGESYAIMGLAIFAEYLNAIAVITISDAPDLATITVTPAQGTTSGTFTATLSGDAGTEGNVLKYRLGAAATPVEYGENVRNWKNFAEGAEIAATTGQYVTVVEADQYYKAIGFGSAQVTVKA